MCIALETFQKLVTVKIHEIKECYQLDADNIKKRTTHLTVMLMMKLLTLCHFERNMDFVI